MARCCSRDGRPWLSGQRLIEMIVRQCASFWRLVEGFKRLRVFTSIVNLSETGFFIADDTRFETKYQNRDLDRVFERVFVRDTRE